MANSAAGIFPSENNNSSVSILYLLVLNIFILSYNPLHCIESKTLVFFLAFVVSNKFPTFFFFVK